MNSIYNLKPAFQKLLHPLVSILAQKGISPNQITWLALLLSVLEGSAIALTNGEAWTLFTMPVILFIRMALNALDGMLAKEYAMQSKKGAMLNEMGDVLSDIALYLPLAIVYRFSGVWIVLFVIIAILTEMAGILGEVIGGKRRFDGPMGKSDRAFFIGILTLLLGLGVVTDALLEWMIIIATLMGMWTILRRCQRGLK